MRPGLTAQAVCSRQDTQAFQPWRRWSVARNARKVVVDAVIEPVHAVFRQNG